MIKEAEDRFEVKPVIDLAGPQGNAFCLLGMAHDLATRLGLDSKEIRREMQETNYENLIHVFDKYFGDHVDLQR